MSTHIETSHKGVHTWCMFVLELQETKPQKKPNINTCAITKKCHVTKSYVAILRYTYVYDTTIAAAIAKMQHS